MYVVLGANGRAGGEAARALTERGEAVRVVLRRKERGEKWKALGAEVANANIEDAEAMADALKGASGAFLLNPPPVSGDPYARTEKLGTALAVAARRAHLPKAVVLSSIGAQHASGTGVIATLNRFETLLDGVAPATAFLRSGYFVETWGEVAETVMTESVLPTLIAPSQRIPMVSTIDVGRAAATLLCEDWTGRRIVELGGPEDWSAGDVASAFAEVLGRPVVPVPIPKERRPALLAEEGVPREVASALLGMYEGIANGLFLHQNDSERRRGTISLTTAKPHCRNGRTSGPLIRSQVAGLGRIPATARFNGQAPIKTGRPQKRRGRDTRPQLITVHVAPSTTQTSLRTIRRKMHHPLG